MATLNLAVRACFWRAMSEHGPSDSAFPDYLYDQIDDFNLSERLQDLQQANDNLQGQIQELKSEVATVNEKYAALEKQNETLQTNISTLFKTAKAEISRKDRMYQDVRSQLEKYQINDKKNLTKPKLPNPTYSLAETKNPKEITNPTPINIKPSGLCDEEKLIHIENKNQKDDQFNRASHQFPDDKSSIKRIRSPSSHRSGRQSPPKRRYIDQDRISQSSGSSYKDYNRNRSRESQVKTSSRSSYDNIREDKTRRYSGSRTGSHTNNRLPENEKPKYPESNIDRSNFEGNYSDPYRPHTAERFRKRNNSGEFKNRNEDVRTNFDMDRNFHKNMTHVKNDISYPNIYNSKVINDKYDMHPNFVNNNVGVCNFLPKFSEITHAKNNTAVKNIHEHIDSMKHSKFESINGSNTEVSTNNKMINVKPSSTLGNFNNRKKVNMNVSNDTMNMPDASIKQKSKAVISNTDYTENIKTDYVPCTNKENNVADSKSISKEFNATRGKNETSINNTNLVKGNIKTASISIFDHEAEIPIHTVKNYKTAFTGDIKLKKENFKNSKDNKPNSSDVQKIISLTDNQNLTIDSAKNKISSTRKNSKTGNIENETAVSRKYNNNSLHFVENNILNNPILIPNHQNQLDIKEQHKTDSYGNTVLKSYWKKENSVNDSLLDLSKKIEDSMLMEIKGILNNIPETKHENSEKDKTNSSSEINISDSKKETPKISMLNDNKNDAKHTRIADLKNISPKKHQNSSKKKKHKASSNDTKNRKKPLDEKSNENTHSSDSEKSCTKTQKNDNFNNSAHILKQKIDSEVKPPCDEDIILSSEKNCIISDNTLASHHNIQDGKEENINITAEISAINKKHTTVSPIIIDNNTIKFTVHRRRNRIVKT